MCPHARLVPETHDIPCQAHQPTHPHPLTPHHPPTTHHVVGGGGAGGRADCQGFLEFACLAIDVHAYAIRCRPAIAQLEEHLAVDECTEGHPGVGFAGLLPQCGQARL